MHPPVTWLLPVRNGMPFLPQTLASIESQTYRNWTILVWDNGSTDGTIEELHRWIPSRLPGRIVIGDPLPLGDSLARLVEMCPTELCARIDADDLNHPQRLERQVAFAETHPAIGLVGSNVELIDAHGNARPCPDPPRADDAQIRWEMRWRNHIYQPSVLMRKSVALRAGNYRDVRLRAPGADRLAGAEDHDMWFRMSLRTEMANLPEPLLQYRHHAGSSSQNDPNYLHYFRMIAERYADSLFPGFSPADALALREKATRDTDLPVDRIDIANYRRAAVQTAVALGKPPAYFMGTPIYREYRQELIRNYVVQRSVGRAMIGLKRMLKIRLTPRAAGE